MKHTMKAWIFFLILLTNNTTKAQDNTATLTLRQCVETALANNLQAKQAGLEKDKASINLKQARSNQLPDLFGDLTHGLNQGRSIDPFTNSYINQQIFFGNYSLGSSVVLFSGMQLKNLVKQNKLGLEAGKMDVQQTNDDIMLNVLLAYLQVLNNKEQLQQARDQYALTQKQVERLSILDSQGAIIPAQLYDLKGQLANDQLLVINNSNALETAKLTLAQLMNVPYNKNMQVEQITAAEFAAKYEGTPDSIYQFAVSQLAIIKAAEYRRLGAEKGVKVARSGFYPQVSMGANIYTNYSNAARRDIFLNSFETPSGDFVEVGVDKVPVITTRDRYASQKINYTDQFKNNYSTSVGITVRVPIFNLNRARNNVALAKIDLKNTQYIEETAKITLKQSIEQAAFNMDAAYEKYTTLLQQVADFNESFKIAEVRFKAGISTQVDYLIAKNNADRANLNLIIAKYDYVFRTKILDYYSGKLVL
jgi:outer membrane protein